MCCSAILFLEEIHVVALPYIAKILVLFFQNSCSSKIQRIISKRLFYEKACYNMSFIFYLNSFHMFIFHSSYSSPCSFH